MKKEKPYKSENCTNVNRRSLILTLILSLIAILPASAQRVRINGPERERPALEPPPPPQMVCTGSVFFTVRGRLDGPQRFRATIGTGGWIVVVRLDDRTLATLDRLPARFSCDTRTVPDGAHTLTLSLVNSDYDQELLVEKDRVLIDNSAPIQSDADGANASGGSIAHGTVSRPVETAGMPRIALPELAAPQRLPARVALSPNPRLATATLLVHSGYRLYLGLEDGAVAFCDADERKKGGTVVRLPQPDGPVRSLCAGSGTIWWVTESAAGGHVYAYREADHSLITYDLTLPPQASPSAPVPAGVGWVKRVALLRGKTLLFGDLGGDATARVLDPATGALTAPTAAPAPGTAALLPTEALAANGQAPDRNQLFLTANDSQRALLLAVTPGEAWSGGGRNHVRAWMAGADGIWQPVGESGSSVNPAQTGKMALTPYGMATLEPNGIRLLLSDGASAPTSFPRAIATPQMALATANATAVSPRDLPFTRSPGMPWYAQQVALGASGVWWAASGIVFHADLFSDARDAYLPWNDPNMGAITAIAADRDGVWVATASHGIRRIVPGNPSSRFGYDGFIRARLGAESANPPRQREQAIASAIEEWQGVPYVWGGESRSGTDCSGFVGAMHRVGGVSIPRTSAEMGTTHQGLRVRDELRWGDTLVFPGHCALYVGDGRTAETVGGSDGGSVSRSNIWSRDTVVVRRFLP